MATKATAIYVQLNGSFNVDKKYKGFRIRKKGFKTKKEAEQYLEEEKERIDKISRDERGIKLKRISLETLYKEYLSMQNLISKTVRNKTQLFYIYIYTDWPVISQKEDRDFVALYNSVIEKVNQKGISKKRGNAALNLLSNLIIFGKNKGYIRYDVSTHEEMYFRKATSRVSKRTENNFLLVGQYEMLIKSLDFLKAHPDLLHSLMLDVDDFEFFLYMFGHLGLRIGEMRALTFNDLFQDVIDDKVVYKVRINKQFSDESHEIYNWTKTGAERNAVVPDFLVEKINAHKLKHHFDDDDYIFNTACNKRKNDGRSILAKSFREILKKTILTLKENNVLPKHFNHDISCNALRRTAEDYLTTIDAIDSKTASEVMGHSEKVAFIHYKKAQMKSEVIISTRQENNTDNNDNSRQDVIDVPVMTPSTDVSAKSIEEIKCTSTDDIIKILQGVVIDHLMGKINDDDFNKIKEAVHKLFV